MRSRWWGRGSAGSTNTNPPTAASCSSRACTPAFPSPRSSSTCTQSSARASGGSGSAASSSARIRGSKSVISGSSTGSIDSGSAWGTTVGVVDDRERLAPVALPAEQPVAQLVGDRGFAGAHLLEPPDDAVLGVGHGQAVERHLVVGRRHADAVAGVGLGPLGRGRVGRQPTRLEPRIGRTHHAGDGELEFVGELEVALVVRRHRHDRTGAVAHQHVVGDEHRDVPAVGGVLGERAGEHARLLAALGLTLELRLLRRELAVRGDRLGRELVEPERGPPLEGRVGGPLIRDDLIDQGMLGREHHVGGAEQACRDGW